MTPDALSPHVGDPCTHVTTTGPDGATLVACAYGGHLLSWTPATSPEPRAADQLWLSPLARCGDGAAIRGGVPVIFPQFATRGPLPRHGFVRDRPWQLSTGIGATADADGAALVRAVLSDDESTRAVWPHRFTLTLTATATAATLTMTLSVRNDGKQSFEFAAALHSYLRIHAGGAGGVALIEGLDGAPAQDNTADAAPITLPTGALAALQARDIAVPAHRGSVRLVQSTGELTLDRDGFDDLVVWNPGPDHGLADVPATGPLGAAGFVCIEPAQLTPVTLLPAATWQAGVTFTASVFTALVPAR